MVRQMANAAELDELPVERRTLRFQVQPPETGAIGDFLFRQVRRGKNYGHGIKIGVFVIPEGGSFNKQSNRNLNRFTGFHGKGLLADGNTAVGCVCQCNPQ